MELSISLLEVGLDRSVPESRIWRWDRGYSTAEQSPPARFAVHCAVCHQRIIIIGCNTCACAVHNNGQRRRVQKSDAGADEKLKINGGDPLNLRTLITGC